MTDPSNMSLEQLMIQLKYHKDQEESLKIENQKIMSKLQELFTRYKGLQQQITNSTDSTNNTNNNSNINGIKTNEQEETLKDQINNKNQIITQLENEKIKLLDKMREIINKCKQLQQQVEEKNKNLNNSHNNENNKKNENNNNENSALTEMNIVLSKKNEELSEQVHNLKQQLAVLSDNLKKQKEEEAKKKLNEINVMEQKKEEEKQNIIKKLQDIVEKYKNLRKMYDDEANKNELSMKKIEQLEKLLNEKNNSDTSTEMKKEILDSKNNEIEKLTSKLKELFIRFKQEQDENITNANKLKLNEECNNNLTNKINELQSDNKEKTKTISELTITIEECKKEKNATETKIMNNNEKNLKELQDKEISISEMKKQINDLIEENNGLKKFFEKEKTKIISEYQNEISNLKSNYEKTILCRTNNEAKANEELEKILKTLQNEHNNLLLEMKSLHEELSKKETDNISANIKNQELVKEFNLVRNENNKLNNDTAILNERINKLEDKNKILMDQKEKCIQDIKLETEKEIVELRQLFHGKEEEMISKMNAMILVNKDKDNLIEELSLEKSNCIKAQEKIKMLELKLEEIYIGKKAVEDELNSSKLETSDLLNYKKDMMKQAETYLGELSKYEGENKILHKNIVELKDKIEIIVNEKNQAVTELIKLQQENSHQINKITRENEILNRKNKEKIQLLEKKVIDIQSSDENNKSSLLNEKYEIENRYNELKSLYDNLLDSKKEIENHNSDVSQKLIEKENKLMDLRDKSKEIINQLKDTVKSLTNDQTLLKQERDDLLCLKNETESKLHTLENKLHQAGIDKANQSNELRKLKEEKDSQLTNLQHSMTKKEKNIIDLESINEELQKQKANLHIEIDTLKNENGNRIVELEKEKNTELNLLKTKLEEVLERNDNFNLEINHIKEINIEKDKIIREIEEEKAKIVHEGKLYEQNSIADMKNLSIKNDKLEERLVNITEALKKSKTEYDTVLENSESLLVRQKELETNLFEQQQQVDRLTNDKKNFGEKILMLNAKLEENLATRKQLELENDEKQKKLEILQEEIENVLITEKSNHESKLNDLLKECKELHTRKTEIEKQNDQLTRELQEKLDTIFDLKNEIQSMKEHFEQNNSIQDQLKQEIIEIKIKHKKEISHYQEVVENMKKEIIEVKESSEATNDKHSSENKNLIDKMIALEKINNELNHSIVISKGIIESLEIKNKDLVCQNDEIKTLCNDLKQENEITSANEKTAIKEHDILLEKIKKYDKIVSELEDKLKDNQIKFTSEINAHITSQINEKERYVKERDDLIEKNKSIIKSMDLLESSQEKLLENEKTFNEKIILLENQLNNSHRHNEEEKKNLTDQFHEKIKILEEKIINGQRERESLENEKEQVVKKLHDLFEKFKLLKQKSDHLQKQLQDQEEREKEKIVEVSSTLSDSYNEKIKIIQDEFSTLKNENNKLLQSNDSILNEFSMLQLEIKKKNEEANLLNNSIEDKENQYCDLFFVHNNLRLEMEENNQKISTYMNKIVNLEEQKKNLICKLQEIDNLKDREIILINEKLKIEVESAENARNELENYRKKAHLALKMVTNQNTEYSKKEEDLKLKYEQELNLLNNKIKGYENFIETERVKNIEIINTNQEKTNNDILEIKREFMKDLSCEKQKNEINEHTINELNEKIDDYMAMKENYKNIVSNKEILEKTIEKLEIDIQTKSDLAKEMLQEKDKEINTLMDKINNLSNSNSTFHMNKSIEIPDNHDIPIYENGITSPTDIQILKLARVQALRDEEANQQKKIIAQLNEDIKELKLMDEKYKTELEDCKRKLNRADKLAQGNDSLINVEYLKHAVYKILTAPNGQERERLIPVVAAVLHLSPEETKEVKTASKSSVGSLFRL